MMYLELVIVQATGALIHLCGYGATLTNGTEINRVDKRKREGKNIFFFLKQGLSR